MLSLHSWLVWIRNSLPIMVKLDHNKIKIQEQKYRTGKLEAGKIKLLNYRSSWKYNSQCTYVFGLYRPNIGNCMTDCGLTISLRRYQDPLSHKVHLHCCRHFTEVFAEISQAVAF